MNSKTARIIAIIVLQAFVLTQVSFAAPNTNLRAIRPAEDAKARSAVSGKTDAAANGGPRVIVEQDGSPGQLVREAGAIMEQSPMYPRPTSVQNTVANYGERGYVTAEDVRSLREFVEHSSGRAGGVANMAGTVEPHLIGDDFLGQFAEKSLIIAVNNHADDVEFRAGGIIYRLNKLGAQLYIAILNHGAVEFAQDGQIQERGVTAADYIRIKGSLPGEKVTLEDKIGLRLEEAHAGAIALSVPEDRIADDVVHGFNFGAGDTRSEEFQETMGFGAAEVFVETCNGWLEKSGKESLALIVDNNEMYPHPAHNWAATDFLPQAITLLADRLNVPPAVLIGGIKAKNPTITHLLPVTAEVHQRKKGALAEHGTQDTEKLFLVMDEVNAASEGDLQVTTPYVERYRLIRVEPGMSTDEFADLAKFVSDPSATGRAGGIVGMDEDKASIVWETFTACEEVIEKRLQEKVAGIEEIEAALNNGGSGDIVQALAEYKKVLPDTLEEESDNFWLRHLKLQIAFISKTIPGTPEYEKTVAMVKTITGESTTPVNAAGAVLPGLQAVAQSP